MKRFWRRRTEEADNRPRAELVLAVSDAGWQGILRHPDDAAPTTLGGEEPVADGPAASATEIMRRAVRGLPAGTRNAIGTVRLLLSDPATCLVDSRFARIRDADPALLAERGARLLAEVPRAEPEAPEPVATVHATRRFGRSSEHEAPRAAFAFTTPAAVRDVFGALDLLATRLTVLAPAECPVLAEASAGGTPLAAIEVGMAAATLLLADPITGAVARRVLPCGGLRGFAEAMADAVGMPVAEAAAGLARRDCLPDDAATGPATASEAALRPVLAALRAEVRESLDYFVFQRLAGAPERLLVNRAAGRIRGLEAWLARVFEVPAATPFDAIGRFAGEAPGMNLLAALPDGLLRVGRVEYRFRDGALTPKPIRAEPRASPRASPRTDRRAMPATVGEAWRAAIEGAGDRRALAPGLATLGLAGAVWLLPSVTPGSPLAGVVEALSAAQVHDAASRTVAQRRRAAAATDASATALFWADKLDAISGAAPPALWLSRAALVGDAAAGTAPSRGAPGARLVLEGHVPASSADPLAQIASFLEALAGDRRFMRGIGSLTLESAQAERDEVRFNVVALLDSGQAATP